jgi:hypothetical protein
MMLFSSCALTLEPLANVRFGLEMVIVGGIGVIEYRKIASQIARSEKLFCTSYSGLKRL